MRAPGTTAPESEVRSYVRRLILSIFVGIVLMTSSAIWAWHKYGAKLDQAPPLPPGSPPMNEVR